MFVDQDISVTFSQDTEAVKGLDVALQFIAGHHMNDDLDPFLARLIKILILNIEG
jgi:hypothetical protein